MTKTAPYDIWGQAIFGVIFGVRVKTIEILYVWTGRIKGVGEVTAPR